MDRLEYLTWAYNTMRDNGLIHTQNDFAKSIGIDKSTLSRAFSGNPKYLTDSLISKIKDYMERFQPETISTDLTKEPERSMSALAAPYQNMRRVPTIPIHAYRAVNFDVMEYFNETHDDVRMSPIVMQFPGTDCYYFVNSEDMTPHLRMNDLLCLSRLPDNAKVTNGDICIINTKHQGMLERFVYDDGDALILKATQPRWTDMRIPKEEIFNIFRILGSIRTNL